MGENVANMPGCWFPRKIVGFRLYFG